MLIRFGLPGPQISTLLYGTIALFLAMVYALAAGTIHFASQTDQAVSRFHLDGLGNVALAARV